MLSPKYINLFLTGLIFSLFILILPVYGTNRGFGPESYPGSKPYGIGTYFAPKEIKIYAEPNKSAQLLETIRWKSECIQVESDTKNIDYPEQVFLVYFPYNNIALMTVLDEDNDWLKVIYDYKNNLSGWVYLKDGLDTDKKNDYMGKYFTWLEFMQKIAKFKGLYFITGVPEDSKVMKSSSEDTSKNIVTKFTHIKHIELILIRGNWILVKAIDFDNSAPIGWIRWRDDNGQLLMFCNLD